ncbi:4-hydroxy-tetrahydrodipicolinate synthase [Candidatus Methanomassiliicoccus intestinalis]|uniref:4-hydroxy-tetrahydrodipicolinate synthase n=1 Tax=Candidatus Methanomassiliicoccus intestinalis TaxID=1406512 RepID=UPI0037DD122A
MFSGCSTAIITPMKADGAIDEEGLRELVKFQEENGVKTIVPCGSTGESATLSYEEHLQVIKIVVDAAQKAKVMAGAGSNSTSEALELSKAAEDIGADSLLSITPYYNKPTAKGVRLHFEKIAAAIEIPVIVYNIPSRTGMNISADLMLELAKIPGIAGVKEASGNLNQIAKIAALAPKDFCVLSGDDALTLPAMAVGAQGAISVSSNITPAKVVRMIEEMLKGNVQQAREINQELMPLYEALFLETNPIPIKTAMRLAGHPAGPLRLPLCDMDEKNEERLKSVLAQQGLL